MEGTGGRRHSEAKAALQVKAYTPRMSAPTRCFTYSLRAFPSIGDRDLILALLARITPDPRWNGCVVQLYENRTGDEQQVRVGVTGPEAVEVAQLLVTAWEQVGIPVQPVDEKGVAVENALVRVAAGRWESAD